MLIPFLFSASTAAAAGAVAAYSADDLAETARSVHRGEPLRIEGMTLDGSDAPSGLDLVRFDPVPESAHFVEQSASGPRDLVVDRPVYFLGTVDGVTGSVAVLSVHGSGEMRGVVSAYGSTWVLGHPHGSALRSRRIDKDAIAARPDFACDTMDNPSPARGNGAGATSSGSTSNGANAAADIAADAATAGSATLTTAPVTSELASYTASVALELDYDFYSKFAPDSAAAIQYALDLVAFTSALGQSELSMSLEIPYIQLWTTSADPYSSTMQDRLSQLVQRWNTAGERNCAGTDCTTIPRSTVLMLSAATNGGIAYVPGICDWYHSRNNGHSYAFVGGISGRFDLASPSVVWDIVATTHELGHNFGSPHTHCYDPPIDECWGTEPNCYAGATSLPSGCPGSGAGCGTIMSYCHQLPGGINNITLTYGAGHPYGDAPERVNATIASQLATEYAAAPACLVSASGMQQLAVSRSGTGAGTVTSNPPGINCGSTCQAYFPGDTTVTLTATPNAFSTFSGWSGDADCSDGVVKLSAAASCIATFTGSCGGSNCDDGDACTTDSCTSGACVHASTPRSPAQCYQAQSSHIRIADSPNAQRDRLSWKWRSGAAFAQTDLGAPSVDTDYSLCVYDQVGGVSRLATSLALPGGAPHWLDRTPGGWLWSDGSAEFDGVQTMRLTTGPAGKTKVRLSAAGALLPLPLPYSGAKLFAEDTSVVVQLVASNDRCWTSTFTRSSTASNTSSAFRAAGQ